MSVLALPDCLRTRRRPLRNLVPPEAVSHDDDAVSLSWHDPKRWSYQAGVAFITGSTIDDLLLVDGKFPKGPWGRAIYLVQVSYKAAELEPELFGHRFPIDLELPLVLGIVNQHRGSPFLQYSGGVTLRWKKFPWNEWVYTTVETGIGLTYSQHVLEAERERHPNRERSHLEFYWPVQLTVAHPLHRQHQFVLPAAPSLRRRHLS
jgi:hypothetical protein